MARGKGKGRGEEYWRGMLRRFAASGLSVRAFCRQEQAPESAFYFWRRTLRQREAASSGAVPAFLPVALREEIPRSPAAVAIELGSGLTIRFSDSASVERIAALVRALQSSEAQP